MWWPARPWCSGGRAAARRPASSWTPSGSDNEDFEIAHCEFTDCVDGVFIGNVRNFIAIGLNFADHAAESNLPIPAEPVVFDCRPDAMKRARGVASRGPGGRKRLAVGTDL